MIKKEDLRLGNWVKHNDIVSCTAYPGDIFRWCIGNFLDLECAKLFMDSIDPVPITPEILVAAGFEGGPWFKKSLGLWPVGPEGINNLVLGKTSSPDGLPFCPAIEQASGQGFTIQQAAEIQKQDGVNDDNAFPLKAKSMVVLPKINYVHELQNLWHMLTGQELEIKLAETV